MFFSDILLLFLSNCDFFFFFFYKPKEISEMCKNFINKKLFGKFGEKMGKQF